MPISTVYRIDFERIGANYDIAPATLTASDPGELAAAIHDYAQRYRPGYLQVDLTRDLLGGQLHQGIGDLLGTFTVSRVQRVTAGELAEQLRQFPAHHEVWVAVPGAPEGYMALTGQPYVGQDPDPHTGDPKHFVVLHTGE
ncbi:hypothetical protein GCM10010411_76690 [Actinomadura fulvescens]|uniref:Uncharacterized protein n=1 Tax=Actinomadura fulvescens TaxID=46160 RepID=A0ABN3QJI6_9ACTN